MLINKVVNEIECGAAISKFKKEIIAVDIIL
jgi:hypothetical protein